MPTTQVARQIRAEADLDAALIEICARWNPAEEEAGAEAIGALCARVESAVRRLAGRELRSSLEVEDLCQEGLVALLIASRRGPCSDAPAGGAQMHTILKARIIDLARRRSARKRAEVATQLFGDLAPRECERALAREDADPLAALELEQRLAGELAALPIEQRRALEARVFEGVPTAELAARLERSEEAVRQLLLRARRRLRHAFASRQSIAED